MLGLIVKNVNFINQMEKTKIEVLKMISKDLDTNLKTLMSSNRTPKIVDNKHVAMYILYRYSLLNYREVCEVFKIKSHSSVIHAIKKCENLKLITPELNKYKHIKLKK